MFFKTLPSTHFLLFIHNFFEKLLFNFNLYLRMQQCEVITSKVKEIKSTNVSKRQDSRTRSIYFCPLNFKKKFYSVILSFRLLYLDINKFWICIVIELLTFPRGRQNFIFFVKISTHSKNIFEKAPHMINRDIHSYEKSVTMCNNNVNLTKILNTYLSIK